MPPADVLGALSCPWDTVGMSDQCVWPVARECLPTDITAEEDRLRLQEAVDTAVGVLWALTGRQYGCAVTLARPCPSYAKWQDDYAAAGVPAIGMTPVLWQGAWRNVGCGGGCDQDGPSVVTLPGPVASIIEVAVDGVALDEDSYSLEGNKLIRAGGREWPHQDLTRPYGEPGTWTVMYFRGVPPPPGAALAVAQLAREFWAVCSGGKCRLPKRTISVQRQGVTITRADPTDLLANKQTGIPEVDLWIAAHNPYGISEPARVGSPDVKG